MATLTEGTSAINTGRLEGTLSPGVLGCGYHLHGFGDFLDVFHSLESDGN